MNDPKKSVLIVDDEPGFHALFKLLLEPLGFEVLSAKDGVEGWEAGQKQNPDVVVSDVHMPRMRGPELFEKIKKFKPEQPVIMMSSGSDPQHTFEKKM